MPTPAGSNGSLLISIESGGRANGTRCCGCSPAISTTSGPLRGGAARRAARRRHTDRPAAVTPVGETWLRAGSVRRRSTPDRGPAADARLHRAPARLPAVRARCCAAACAFRTNVPGDGPAWPWRTSSPQLVRWRAAGPAWWRAVAASTSAHAGCAISTTNALGAATGSASRPRSWPHGWRPSGPGCLPTSSPWRAFPGSCATSCSTPSSAGTRCRHRSTRYRSGSSSAAWKGQFHSPRRP